MNYDIDYFIRKFEAIPFHKWTRKWLKNKENQCCAMGHCGPMGPWEIEDFPECIALIRIFVDNNADVTAVNDLSDEHPKLAILAALRSFR